MDYRQQRQAAREFAEMWKGRGYEKGETQQFWIDLLRDVCGVRHTSSYMRFEPHMDSGGFADCLIPESRVLVEQKSINTDLDRPEQRQGRMVTPFEQAQAYVDSFKPSSKPRFIVICNFQTFRVYDSELHSRNELPSNYVEFTLEELGENPSLVSFLTDPATSRAEKERQASVKAGELISKLYRQLAPKYIDPESAESQHALNVLCVRMVFCLFCEDAGLFPKDAFLDYLRHVSPADMRNALKRLFKALDTPIDQRDPYDESVKPFPYVNGALFRGEFEIPNFDQDLKTLLLLDVSQNTDWSTISPTIFGAMFESTLNPDTRHEGGMHYTSVQNIHKVIDPLFLDGLQDEFESILTNGNLTDSKRKSNLLKLHRRICNMKFLDPACGSGNFLTETYLCLRRLEDSILDQVYGGQSMLVWDEGDGVPAGKRVSLSQFYGIEINDFAVSVAMTSLWIARLQANAVNVMLEDAGAKDFPLHDRANIVQANALRMDWNDVLPASECTYIMGNPPFLGARNQTREQKEELAEVFHGARNCGNVDYVAGWYIKAAEYVGGNRIRTAFVSTNSICQGEQVANVWKPIYDLGFRIDFAHNTFRWTNEAADMAHVFCIIVGFSRLGGKKVLFRHVSPDAEAEIEHPSNINAYLADAPDNFIWNRSTPICNVLGIGIGNKPIDGGNYLFKPEEKRIFLEREPQAEPFFKRWIGSDEFINGKERWVLWLGDATPAQINSMPACKERILAVRDSRLASTSASTRRLAERPTRFHVENMPEGHSILIPKVSSERRRYIPMGFIGPETFCSDLVFLIPDATLCHYGVLQSQFHNAWMRVVCGRLKSDYRYSAGVVYNNFIWPNPTDAQREKVERAARAVLDARERYSDSTLKDMYDPNNDFLYPDLMRAHRALDKAVEEAYGVDFDGDEEKIVAHLFKLYAEAVREQ